MRKIKLFSFFLIAGLMFVGNVSAGNFTCKIGNYTIEYNNKGEIQSAKNSSGKKVDKYLESYFKPTKSSECPTDKEAKVSIIDGSRTLYVAKIDETFGGSGGNSDSKTCAGFGEKECKSSENPKCVWATVDGKGFCSVNGLSYLSCGDAKDIPPVVPTLTSYAVNILKIVTPIILILVGIIELVKAMASSNEDSMKKAQSKLIKKVAAAVMVFFVITIVQFVILKVADSGETGSIKKCLKCFLNNQCGESTYYKDGYGMCYSVSDSQKSCDCETFPNCEEK